MPARTIAPENIQGVLDHVIPHISKHLQAQANGAPSKPFILGLTGLQGSGKSTWTDALVQSLNETHNYNSINLSLDDLYLDHDDLVRVRTENPSNKLLQTRGQPGTHDAELSVAFFQSLGDRKTEILIPSFDKSLFHGEGGRAPIETWRRIPQGTTVDVIVFEGWCVGFQPLDEKDVRLRWDATSQYQIPTKYPTKTLKEHAIEHLLQVNKNLRQYCDLFMGPQHFDFLVHLDTNDLVNVYEWRIQQEHALRQRTSSGMTDDQVVAFVKGYMPAYELYLDQLRRGFFRFDQPYQGQLRVVLNKDRKVVETILSR
ncbi:hypothetical protein N7532_004429 [Penicillium argentinense]|uniref:P-loop containing nucleoside triphosphate hydrolase protein n=1 Tax=Penicillium argentinense TaxID=1131581 RepID=A0A9W9FPD9_9EURO|nr:uncharacterized protein N7532_004429 [Penicillium argentinense]KAJ5103900.1 hypothetical protein N7532_004429 [Penicillium argentinense]